MTGKKMHPATMITKTIYKKEIAGRQVIVLKNESPSMTWFCGYVSKHFFDDFKEDDILCGMDITFDGLGRGCIPGVRDETEFYGFDTANARTYPWPLSQQRDYAIWEVKRWAEELTAIENDEPFEEQET